MYDVSELAYFSVLVLVIHVGEVSILRADGEGIVAAPYEVPSSSPITASLQGSAEAPCEFAHSESPHTPCKEGSLHFYNKWSHREIQALSWRNG